MQVGNSPLHVAAEVGNAAVVPALLEHFVEHKEKCDALILENKARRAHIAPTVLVSTTFPRPRTHLSDLLSRVRLILSKTGM